MKRMGAKQNTETIIIQFANEDKKRVYIAEKIDISVSVCRPLVNALFMQFS